jgi:hypothetical protein
MGEVVAHGYKSEELTDKILVYWPPASGVHALSFLRSLTACFGSSLEKRGI